jgi:hypothetical protein
MICVLPGMFSSQKGYARSSQRLNGSNFLWILPELSGAGHHSGGGVSFWVQDLLTRDFADN